MHMPEPLAKALVGLLVSLPLVVFAAKVFWPGESSAGTPSPTWMNQLLITAGRWPLADGAPDTSDARVAGLLERSTSIAYSYSPSTVTSAAAVSLLTGLWPIRSGVLMAGDRLPAGTWTIASALAETGSLTAAILGEPLISSSGLEGFESVVEQQGASPKVLAALVIDVWERERERPTFVWVHLAEAGPGGRNVGELLQQLERAPGGLDESRRSQSLILLTAFGSDGAITDTEDSGFRIPLSLALPADVHAGQRSRGMACLTEIPQLILGALSLPPPIAGFDASPSIVDSFEGVAVYNWMLLQGPLGHVLRDRANRLTAPGFPPASRELVRSWRVGELGEDSGFVWKLDDDELYSRLLDQLLARSASND